MPRIWNLTSQIIIWTVIHPVESQRVILVGFESSRCWIKYIYNLVKLIQLNTIMTPGTTTKCVCPCRWAERPRTLIPDGSCVGVGKKWGLRNHFLPMIAKKKHQNLAMSRNQRRCRKYFLCCFWSALDTINHIEKNYILVRCGKGYLHFNMFNLSCQ